MITEKHTTPDEDEFYEYLYYLARIQWRFITTKRTWFIVHYPHTSFIGDELDNANSIDASNHFEEGHKGHFRPADLAFVC